MPKVMIELVVFTLQEGSLWLGTKPALDGLVLPREQWDGRQSLLQSAWNLAADVTSYRMMMTPRFVGNVELSAPEAGLSVCYAVCATPSMLGADLHLAPIKTERREDELRFFVEPGPTAQLQKRERRVVYEAGEWLQANLGMLPLVPAMLDEKFTLTQLQDAVELVTGVGPDKRHFRRQAMESDWLEPTGEKVFGAHRPAMLYRLSRSF